MSRAAEEALLLGVDGGGTSTEVWLARPGGVVLGRGRAGPSNAKAVGVDAARRALADAITSACAEARLEPTTADAACFGLAGFDRPDEREMLEGWVREARWADRLVLANDGDLVVAAGTPEGWGVGVIAGTGSIAVGRSPDGRKARAGGWGYLIGDEGSAYAVVISALNAVSRRADGRDSSPNDGDPLADRLCRALGVEISSQIVSALYAPGMDRARIAGLAPEVLAASRDNPTCVAPILQDAGVALAEQVASVAKALGLDRDGLPLAMAGGFLLSAGAVSSAMHEALADQGFRVMVTAVPEPVRGAILLAERALADA